MIEEEGEILASFSPLICLSYSPLIVKFLLHYGDMEIDFQFADDFRMQQSQ